MLTAIREFRPTYFPAVPTVFVSLLNHPKVGEYGLERVRLFNSGGAPCPVEVMEEFERRIGRPLNEGYGLSETSPVTHSTPQLALRKPGTIGLPVPGHRHQKIVDVETGERELPIGEIGELCISGPQVMKGYWNKPEESAHVAAHGCRRPDLVPHRRHRAHRRGRLHLDRPAQEGHDHRRRLQRLPVGRRVGALQPSRRCGSRR